jgi:hypothetical protein
MQEKSLAHLGTTRALIAEIFRSDFEHRDRSVAF